VYLATIVFGTICLFCHNLIYDSGLQCNLFKHKFIIYRFILNLWTKIFQKYIKPLYSFLIISGVPEKINPFLLRIFLVIINPNSLKFSHSNPSIFSILLHSYLLVSKKLVANYTSVANDVCEYASRY